MQVIPKAAIVTGGGTGVGRATALRLAKLDCAVLVNYSRSRDEAQQTVADIKALGGRALAVEADVADDTAVRAMVAKAVETFGRLDLLVNNAATTRFIPAANLDDVSDADWQRILMVNLVGPFHCARAAQQPILDSGGGQIINVSSVAAFSAKGSSLPYAASKAALNNLTLGLARTLAPHIRVNAVAPGFITGRWLQQGYGDAYEAVKRSTERKNLLGKVCSPDDVAATIVGLATGSPLVTGQVIVVDGGMLVGH
ncbi:MAG TPA: SDR family NAD(P)-dependent oxidoreductase [Pirellulales bacterium]|jgi:NAD(P)-dependent dehydrogenase (short-subunit alcohol dehydrogenase family)